jgi:hypothetical protein
MAHNLKLEHGETTVCGNPPVVMCRGDKGYLMVMEEVTASQP